MSRLRDQDVVGLDIPVDDLPLMEVIDPLGDLCEVVPGLALIKPLLIIKKLEEVPVGHVLHHEVMVPVLCEGEDGLHHELAVHEGEGHELVLQVLVAVDSVDRDLLHGVLHPCLLLLNQGDLPELPPADTLDHQEVLEGDLVL